MEEGEIVYYLMQVGAKPGVKYDYITSPRLFDTYEEARLECLALNIYLILNDAPFRWEVSKTI